jgi:ABC-2 type transport system ATP-binding protein
MLVGVLRPDAGHASIAGHDVITDGPAARTRIGYVPEDIPLYGHSRVDEFLAMMAAMKGLGKPDRQHAVDAVVERLSLTEVRRTVIRQLSRGFRQRVAIAQALLGAPPVLVFDEPTNGLDPRQIIECRELIAGLAGTHAVLITSHILSEIERVADRVAILLDGRLLALEDMTLGDGARLDLERRFLELTEQRT